MTERINQSPHDPRQDVKLIWGGKRDDVETRNHYCTNCQRTSPFRVADDLQCVCCGKRLTFRREGA